MHSPSITQQINRETSSSLESCHSYFGDYVPLSNLPTPPLSAHDWPEDQPCLDFSNDSHNAHLVGPATHLSRLIPSAACLHDPSISHILSYLRRAELPMETIALAACILDTLSTRFARLWRSECPPDIDDDSDNPLDLSTSIPRRQINKYIEPEVIALAALSLAVAFLDDRHITTRYWAHSIARGSFTHAQINTTRRCILLDLNHHIQPLCSAQLIEETIQDMQQVSASLRRRNAAGLNRGRREITPPLLADEGSAMVVAFGLPTPEPSPTTLGSRYGAGGWAE